MENKICVYTVCMNEAQFVDRWVDSMSEADRIVALVHDCKDNTAEKLLTRGVDVRYTHYGEWRFDVGKNDSMHVAMELAPECNILCFTSLDEVWDPGWAQVLKDNWKEDTNICLYKFVQSHKEDGSEDLVTGFNWIHSNDPAWHWKYPIDERICRDDNNFNYIYLFDKLKLNHWPDTSRPRHYVDMRKAMWEEYKDANSLLSFVRDYHGIGKKEELLSSLKDQDLDNLNLDPESKSFILACVADSYWDAKKDIISAKKYFDKAIKADPEARYAYLWFGRILCDLQLFREAEYYLKEGLCKSKRRFSWLESSDDFKGNLFIWLTVATYYQEKYLEALSYAQHAFDLNPKNNLAKNNLDLCKKKIEGLV